MDLRQDRNFFIREGIIRRIRKTSCKNLRIDSSFSRRVERKWFEKREMSLVAQIFIEIHTRLHIYICEVRRGIFRGSTQSAGPNCPFVESKLFPTRQNRPARSARKFIYERKKKKNAWRTIGEYRCAVIRAYSETWEKKKKKEREKKDSRKRGTGSMEVSGERSTRKLSGIQSGSLLASERQRDARTENKVAAAIGLAPLLLLSRPPRLSLDPTHGGGLLFLNLRRSRNARVAAVFS